MRSVRKVDGKYFAQVGRGGKLYYGPRRRTQREAVADRDALELQYPRVAKPAPAPVVEVAVSVGGCRCGREVYRGGVSCLRCRWQTRKTPTR